MFAKVPHPSYAIVPNWMMRTAQTFAERSGLVQADGFHRGTESDCDAVLVTLQWQGKNRKLKPAPRDEESTDAKEKHGLETLAGRSKASSCKLQHTTTHFSLSTLAVYNHHRCGSVTLPQLASRARSRCSEQRFGRAPARLVRCLAAAGFQRYVHPPLAR